MFSFVFFPFCFFFPFLFFFLTPPWVSKCTQVKDYLGGNCEDELVDRWGIEAKRITVNPIRKEKSMLSI